MMANDFLKQDVFFFVSTVAVLAVAMFLSIFLIRLIRLTRKIEYMVDKTKSHAQSIATMLAGILKLRKRK